MIDITTITENSFAANEAAIKDYLKAEYPDLDTTTGSVINELVIKPAASLYAAQDANLTAVLSQFSLSLVSEATVPDLDMAKTLASNYRVTAKGGSKGSGLLAIYTTSYANTYIFSNTVFTAGGIKLGVTKTYVGVVADTVPSDTEDVSYRIASQVSPGLYVFTVPVVTAENTSVVISEGQVANMENQPAFVTKIEVVGAISGGSDQDTAKDLVDKALYGVTAVVPSGSSHIASLFANLENVNILSQKAFGLGDVEMLRDRNNISGVSMGGRTDIYCKTAALPSSYDIVVTASRASVSDNTWTANITNRMAPGFYYIKSISHASSQNKVDGDQVSIEYRAAQEEGGPGVPNTLSARYSTYQAATINFTFDGLAGTTTSFIVTVVALPSIDVLQDYINNNTIRNESQDVLVKAPVPNRIGLTITCTVPPGVNEVTVEDIRTAAVNAVNATEIGRKFLSAADIVQSIQHALPTVVVAFPMLMTNTVYLPSGKTVFNQTEIGQITAHTSEDQGVTHRNSAFFCQASDVSVTILERETIL